MFKKILIANRGEIAVRIIRACKEWGIPTVAVHSDVDRESMHVRMADESVCIGSHQPANSYLNIPNLMSAIELTNADAVHPGYGFLSENATFAQKVKEAGITFIGPSPRSMELMGDKLSAKAVVKKYNIPMVPGTDEAIEDVEAARLVAEKPMGSEYKKYRPEYKNLQKLYISDFNQSITQFTDYPFRGKDFQYLMSLKNVYDNNEDDEAYVEAELVLKTATKIRDVNKLTIEGDGEVVGLMSYLDTIGDRIDVNSESMIKNLFEISN